MYLSFDWLFIVKKREHNGGDRDDKLDIFARFIELTLELYKHVTN